MGVILSDQLVQRGHRFKARVDVHVLKVRSEWQELYLAFNEVKELSALVSCECLEVLDLEGNAIDDITEIQFLASCSTITSLTLEGNPVQSTSSYRKRVLEALPFLTTLDDVDR
jgi:hypothetical protein